MSTATHTSHRDDGAGLLVSELDPDAVASRAAAGAGAHAPAAAHQLVADDPADAGVGVRGAAALVTLLSVLAVGVGAAAGLDTLRALGASVFFLFGLGSAGTAVLRRVSTPNFLLFSVGSSFTVTLLGGFALAEAGFWHLTSAFLVLAAAALALHARALLTRRDERPSLPGDLRERLVGAAPALVPSVLGLALLVAAAVSHAGSHAGIGGAFARLGPAWFAGLALVVLAVAAAGAPRARWVAGFTVVVLAVALALTPALLYEYPTVTSAARHVGVAQVIERLGGVDRSQGIYHRWPALFAGSDLIWHVGHVNNPLAWSRWAPVLINPVAALGVRGLAQRVLNARGGSPVSPYRLWVAAALFAVVNILGNAYFSPQSVCFVLALIVLMLALPTASSVTGRGRTLRLTGLTVTALAITVTHQLTPYLILPALFLLVVFQLVRPWWVLLLVGLPALAWAAINYQVLDQFVNLSALGQASANAAPPNHGGTLGYRALTKLAIYAPMGLFLLVGFGAALVALRARGRLRWALLACAASPALLFVGNNYGNEALFRAALFSLPWLVTLLAAGRWERRGLRVRVPAVAALLLVGAAVFGLGTYGLDWYRVIRPGTVEAVQRFEQTAPTGSVVLVAGSGNAIPGRLTDRSPDVQYVARDGLHILPATRDYDAASDVAAMTRGFVRTGGAKGYYLLVTTSTGAYDDLYGIQRYADFERMRTAVAATPYWTPVYRSSSATLYRLDVPAYRAVRAR